MTEDEARQQAAAMTAAMDQARAAMSELGGTVVSYRKVLLESGMSEADALQLTINFQTLLLAPIFGAFGAGGAT